MNKNLQLPALLVSEPAAYVRLQAGWPKDEAGMPLDVEAVQAMTPDQWASHYMPHIRGTIVELEALSKELTELINVAERSLRQATSSANRLRAWAQDQADKSETALRERRDADAGRTAEDVGETREGNLSKRADGGHACHSASDRGNADSTVVDSVAEGRIEGGESAGGRSDTALKGGFTATVSESLAGVRGESKIGADEAAGDAITSWAATEPSS
jgi:hypothetical protein